MVVQSDTGTVEERRGCRPTTGLNLELLNPHPPVTHDVADKKRNTQDEVGGHGENHGEERRPQILSAVQPQAVPERLQQRVIPQTPYPKIHTGIFKMHLEVEIIK